MNCELERYYTLPKHSGRHCIQCGYPHIDHRKNRIFDCPRCEIEWQECPNCGDAHEVIRDGYLMRCPCGNVTCSCGGDIIPVKRGLECEDCTLDIVSLESDTFL